MIEKKLFLILVLIGLVACSLENPFKPAEKEEIIVPDTTRYIYTYETWNQMQGGRNTFEALGYPIVDSMQTIHTIVVDVPAGKKVLRKFTSSAGNEYPALYVEKDEWIYELLSIETHGNNRDTTWMWHSTMIQADLAWENGCKGNGATTVIIDGGLCENYRTNPYFAALDTTISYNLYTKSNDVTAGNEKRHGSHVYGINAGQIHHVEENLYIQGIAPESRVGLIMMFDDNYATRAMGLKSLDIAAQYNPDVISMSWGSYTWSPSMALIIEKLSARGIIMVAAAGNGGDAPVIYPARYTPVIAAGAVKSDTTRAWFSSYGDELEIMAPGHNILSFKGCSPGKMSGTSMATPHVSGAITLAIAALREIKGESYSPSLNEIRQALWNSAMSMDDKLPEEGKKWDGFGLIQIMDFLSHLNE